MFWKMIKFFILLPFALITAYLIVILGIGLLVILAGFIG